MSASPPEALDVPRPVEALLAAIEEEGRYISQIRALLIAHEKSLGLLRAAYGEIENALKADGNTPAGQPRGLIAGTRAGAILGCLSNTLRPAEEPTRGDDPVPADDERPSGAMGVQPADGVVPPGRPGGHEGAHLGPRDAAPRGEAQAPPPAPPKGRVKAPTRKRK